MDGDDAREVTREAESIIYAAQWRLWEERVLEQMSRTRGLASAPLLPDTDVIQLVTYDGEHLGHVRLDGPRGPGEQWVAVARTQARPVGRYTSAETAAQALARACGKEPQDSR